ncbi:unnamed protein product, partial [Staurois parvus]
MFLELMASKLYGVGKVRSTKKNAWCLHETWWQCPSVGIMNSQMYCSVLKEYPLRYCLK